MTSYNTVSGDLLRGGAVDRRSCAYTGMYGLIQPTRQSHNYYNTLVVHGKKAERELTPVTMKCGCGRLCSMGTCARLLHLAITTIVFCVLLEAHDSGKGLTSVVSDDDYIAIRFVLVTSDRVRVCWYVSSQSCTTLGRHLAPSSL